MSLDKFWALIDKQLEALGMAQTADDVIRILGKAPDYMAGDADAFFAGGGGDETPAGPLHRAGWTYLWYEANYFWAMKAPNGDVITYIEGDVYRGNRPPMPHNETFALSDCTNWDTNERGDCGGRVERVDGTVICETCRNRRVGEASE